MRQLPLWIALALAVGTATAWGQAGQNPSDPWQMWNVELMIERATKQVATRYHLTPEQTEFTRQLMVQRVNGFLDKHENEIRELFSEAMKYKLGGQALPPEKVQEWTKRIEPMFREAKDLIIEGNHEFRTILDEDQKVIHDIDLKVMEQNFSQVDEKLDSWRAGNFKPEDLNPQPGPRSSRESRRVDTPVRPEPRERIVTPPDAPDAKVPDTVVDAQPAPAPPIRGPRQPRPGGGSEIGGADYWDVYVRRFIANYQLDATQSNQAYAILNDSKKRADEYRASRREDYERVQRQMQTLRTDPQQRDRLTEANTQFQELNKPVNALFDEMRARLDKLPTEEQRKAYEARNAERQARRATTTRPTATQSAASQPVATRPATTQPDPTAQRE